MKFALHRLATEECSLPNCCTVQYHPLLQTELRHGLAVLAGRASPEIAREASKPADAQPATVENHLILLVEDNEINQDVIKTQLKILGYGAEIAENVLHGLEKWQSDRFDLVLADCHMPEMDGFEMTEEIRKREAAKGRSRTPIVAITANALKGEADRCLAIGMDDYLPKPVVPVELKKPWASNLPRPPHEPDHHSNFKGSDPLICDSS